MSEDTIQAASDGAGIWRDPSGILALGEQADSYVNLDHGITLICDSHRSLLARLAVRREARKSHRKQMPCPECNRQVTIYVRR